LLEVAITGDAGTVSAVVEYLVVSFTETAITVACCAEDVAAGAVYVTEVVVWFESVPVPVKLQVTPSAWLSSVTVAVSVIESAPSTDDEGADMDTLVGSEPPELPELPTLPPQPDRQTAATTGSPMRTRPFRNTRHPREDIL
jgi:hypothetical protein